MHIVYPRTGLRVYSPREAADMLAYHPAVQSVTLIVPGVLITAQDVKRMRSRIRNLCTRRGIEGSVSTTLGRQDHIDRTVFLVKRCPPVLRTSPSLQAQIFLSVRAGSSVRKAAREYGVSRSAARRAMSRVPETPPLTW